MSVFTLDQVLEATKTWGSRNEEKASRTQERVRVKTQRMEGSGDTENSSLSVARDEVPRWRIGLER